MRSRFHHHFTDSFQSIPIHAPPSDQLPTIGGIIASGRPSIVLFLEYYPQRVSVSTDPRHPTAGESGHNNLLTRSAEELQFVQHRVDVGVASYIIHVYLIICQFDS